MLESKTGRYPSVVEEIFILAVRLQRYFLSRIHAKSVFGWLPGLVLGVLSIHHLRTLSGQPHQRIPLTTGSAASEHGEVKFVLPRPVLGCEAKTLDVLVPSTKTPRIEADGWTSAPECPHRVHDILEQKTYLDYTTRLKSKEKMINVEWHPLHIFIKLNYEESKNSKKNLNIICW